ncbi:putative nucleolar complex protein 14 [Diplogelasinospora grovesii]|uniref:Nucleolar complex protein 14 n=1 Tax=Diplogelasinospora grovesii TaxID=303347 RepID=A0AAN6S5U0_9PEZI|nr:putative nucleolar complex protein 14 [Diplogelasinospora grovesii]
MAGSQLKRLKSSLREQGIIGPQQSKKQKRKNAEDQKAKPEKRIQRSEALETIREQFNPFQFKTNARGPKFEVTTNRPANDRAARGINGRPGLSKAVGEQRRRETLLVEMQRRNKVGGIVDRRFGENDPTMSLEEKMVERFANEKLRGHKKSNIFDLEDDDEPGVGLTHMGKSLEFDEDEEKPRDDFEGEEVPSDGESDGSHAERRMLKRLRLSEADGETGEEDQPERKKTKKEIYEEIIAKSKHHKYERQAAKEEDDDLRAELDKALPELQALLFQRQKPQPKANEGQAPVLKVAGMDKTALDKDYDIRVKQLAADKRAQPAERTKTDEEKAEEEAQRLKELEEKRLRRMRGEVVDDSDDEDEDGDAKAKKGRAQSPGPDVDMIDEDDEYGLGKGIRMRPTATELGFDDEDDFEIDDDLVASGSDLDLDEDDEDEESEAESEEDDDDDDDDEFTKGLLTEAERKEAIFQAPSKTEGNDADGIPYTFPCPETHADMLVVFNGIEVTKLPVAVQRIRALHHPKLDSGNKERLGKFSQALVHHIAYLGERFEPHWFPTLESLIRHVHSLAKTFPIEVAKAYRTHVEEMEKDRPLALNVGDLVILTAVGTTFPTSDHFHQVVTPAMLSVSRFLGQKIPQDLGDFATGTYLSILALQYQQLSKRYVPELMNFCLNTLCALAHEKPAANATNLGGFFPVHEPPAGIRIDGAGKTAVRKLNCTDCQPGRDLSFREANGLKVAIISTTTAILKAAAELWGGSKVAAFYETFLPAQKVLEFMTSKTNSQHLPSELVTAVREAEVGVARLLKLAEVSRRPLELHHHKPLAIKTFVPKFEDSFDPDKHYDPDRDRAELAKLKAEHKRERKGALRELRKDAQFMAREKLRVKKVKDEAYEKKYKRLVAEIQGEEGREANAYAREKALRQKKRR